MPDNAEGLDMMRFSLTALAVTAILIAPAATAAGGESCPKDTLLSLVDTALTAQPSLPRLAARRYGARAAFLKIRYERLNEQQAATLLNGLVDAGVHGAEELGLAWSIHTLGSHEALARLAKDKNEMLTIALPVSALRALLLTEKGPDILLDRIAATPKERQGSITAAIMTAIIDQPDALKEKVAAVAENRNIPLVSEVIAAHLVASQATPDAWKDFSARHAASGTIGDVTRMVSWAPGLVGNPAWKPPGSTPEADTSRAVINRVVQASAIEPEFDFLNTYLNQTGLINETAAAADVVRKAITDGKIRRNGTLDAAWLLGYRELIKAVGDKEKVDAVFATISIQTGRLNSSGQTTIRDVLDRLLVVEALQPYVTGKTETMPSMPAEISDAMKAAWANWSGMATIVRGGAISPGLAADPATFPLLAELLFAKGDHAALANLIQQTPLGEMQVSAATDFAVRLDRQCASYLSHTAEAVLLSGQPIFKFDTP